MKAGVASAWQHAVSSPELQAWIGEMQARNTENNKPTRKKPRKDDRSPDERKRQKQLEDLEKQHNTAMEPILALLVDWVTGDWLGS